MDTSKQVIIEAVARATQEKENRERKSRRDAQYELRHSYLRLPNADELIARAQTRR